MFAALMVAAALSQAAPPAERRPALDDDTVRRLIDALKDTDFEVRQNLGAALAKAGPRTVPLLREALKDKLVERRSGAAYALGLLGDAARPALPELLDALNDPDTDVRRQASYAIVRVVPAGRAAPAPTTATDGVLRR